MSVDYFGSYYTSYPARNVTRYSYQFEDNSRKVKINYSYEKMIAKDISDAGHYTANVTFTAGEGNIWS